MPCGSINTGSSVECDEIPDGGTNARLLLANYADVEGYTEDVNGVITAIDMAAGTFMYEFLGFRNDMKKSEEVIKPDIGIPKFKHNAGFVVYENTQIQKNNIENIARGTFVAILENKGKNANSFEVVGKGVGLEIVAGPIRNAYENGGFFVISLSTPDDQGVLEPKLPQTLLVTDYAGTLAYLAGLIPAS